MSGLFSTPDELAQGFGTQEGVATGLGALGPSAADFATMREQTLARINTSAGAPGLIPPAAPAYYNPTSNQMFAGGRAFDIRDVGSALQASQTLTPTPPPPGAGWQPLTQRSFSDYVTSLGAPRGTGELLARGARGVAGGLVGGVGALAEFAGAETVGQALRGAGETITGQDEFDKQRSALIQRSNSLFSNIIDATIEAVPMAFATLATGGAGAVAGGALGAARAASVAARTGAAVTPYSILGAAPTTIGGAVGAAAINFPQSVSSLYEAAQNARTPDGRPAYDLNDVSTRATILGGALGISLLDAIAPGKVAGSLSQALRDRIQQAGTETVVGMARAKSVGRAAAGSSATEAGTEALQTVIEQAIFDPQFRSQLTANDWKALAPYVVEKYGENALIAAGAGALLGAGFGGAGRFIETRPRDILQGGGAPAATAGETPQTGAPPAPALPGAQGEMFPGLNLGTAPSPTSTYTVGGGILYPTQPGGQGELFPTMAPSYAPPDMSGQGDLFAGLPSAAAPTPVQGDLFAQPAVSPQPAPGLVGAVTPLPGPQFGPTRAPPTLPAAQVVPSAPALAPETFLTPGMERLRRPTPAPAAPTTLAETEAGNQLLALRRQMELQQAQAQRAAQPAPVAMTAAERDYDLALAQAAIQQPLALDPAAVTTSSNRGLNNARRNLIERFNALTKAEQDNVLTGYNNDPLAFQSAVQNMPIIQVRRAQAEINRLAESPRPPLRRPAPAPAAAAAPAPAPAPTTQPTTGEANAAQVRQVEQGGVGQRTGAGGPVPSKGQDRFKPTKKQGGGGKAGGRNRLIQGRTPAQEVTAAEAAPRPLEQPAAPVAAERAAPSVAPSPEPAAPSRFDDLITRAASSANPQAELRTVRNDLVKQRDVAADAGRSTTELTRAIDRIDTMTAEGAIQATDPQARWATTMDDEGRGYNELSQAGKNAWAQEVARGTPLTRELAADFKQRFPSEDTTKGVAEVNRLMGLLERADDPDRMVKIMDRLDALAESDNDTVARAAKEALGRDRDTGQFSIAEWNTAGKKFNLDGSEAKPMATGRVRMVVQNFVSKLARKPNVTVVANQQELQRTNPALFARANAARSQGDFATANAAGYSFGNGEVIIFTDRIVNEQHLRFVLAHETFGHFGMRGIMPKADFDSLMDRIYESDTQAKLAADAAMEVRGLSKQEAVEEYLSDFAAMLQTSTVMRVWNAIKNILSKLGIKFSDNATRYFLDQSMRYVRDGGKGTAFDLEAVGKRLRDVEFGVDNPGRYSPDAAIAANSIAQMLRDKVGAWPTSNSSWNEVASDITGKKIDFFNSFEDFKNKFFSLLNFRSQDNPALYQLAKLMDSINSIAMSVKNTANEYMRTIMEASGDRQAAVSEVMYDARDYKLDTLDKALLRGSKLVRVGTDGTVAANTDEVDKLFKAGLLTKEQIRKGFTYKYSFEGNDGKQQTGERKVEARPDFSDDDYNAYVKTREAVAYTELELLKAEYNNLLMTREVSFKELRSIMKAGKFENKDRGFVDAFVKRYGELYTENAAPGPFGIETPNPASMAKAEKFLVAVNSAFIGRDTDRNAAIKATDNDGKPLFFASMADADAFIAQMMDTKSRRETLSEARKFDLQNQVKELFLTTYGFETKERVARRNLITGLTPAMREGKYQTRVQAYVNGKPVELKNSHQELQTFSMFDGESQANKMADLLNGEFKGKEFELLVKNDAGEFVPTKVELRATTGRVADAISADPQLELPTFIYGLSRFGIDVDPQAMEKIVTALSRQGSGYRSRLEYSKTPGYDRKAGVAAVARLNESRASIVAKTLTRQQIRELMNLSMPETKALWYGNEAYVGQLRQDAERINADPNASREAKADVNARLVRAEYMYRKTNPEGRANQAMAFYNQASNTLEFLQNNQIIDDQNLGVGPVASRIRSATVIAQMGLSLAQGALNLQSPYSNWMPYMASRNSKTGFGGGFSFPKVVAEYHKALAQIGAPGIASRRMNQAEFYDDVAKSPALQKRHRITAEEARVIAKEIRDGKLIPAQTNSMLALARGYSTNRWVLKSTEAIMSPFNLTEQAARRSAFLAAFRLHRERGIAAGLDPKAAAEEARAFAVDSLDLTLGNYTVVNRPPAWRAGITSFLFMYKTYPITTVQLFSRLSRNGQLAMFAGMFMLAGATGLPFAEDLEDIIDTIAQKLGFRQGSIRAEVIRYLEDQIPGSSAFFLKGFVNSILGIDVASRTSAGNIIPGTGIGLAGANIGREMGDILGPAAGFIKGVYDSAVQIARYPTSPTTTLEDIARNSPVTFLRLMGDSYAYYQSGAVVDRRGYVVSPDMDIGTILTRMAGFYPARAAAQYDIIRIAQRELDYQKEMVASFRQSWVKATLRGDSAAASSVVEAVNEWNNVARGTPLEIRSFMAGNARALREAQRGAGERALRAAPRAAQEDIQGYINALTE